MLIWLFAFFSAVDQSKLADQLCQHVKRLFFMTEALCHTG